MRKNTGKRRNLSGKIISLMLAGALLAGIPISSVQAASLELEKEQIVLVQSRQMENDLRVPELELAKEKGDLRERREEQLGRIIGSVQDVSIGQLNNDEDDWCGNGRRPKPPKPQPVWPLPIPDEPDDWCGTGPHPGWPLPIPDDEKQGINLGSDLTLKHGINLDSDLTFKNDLILDRSGLIGK